MSASTESANATQTADRELVFTRVFDAPRELVFKTWTDSKHVAKWWGPNGFTNTIEEMDVRPGGVWLLVMHGPDGVDYRTKIVYLEVVKPERLVYKHEPEKGSEPVDFQVTVTFADQGGKTELTMRMLFPSAEALDHNVKKYRSIEGAKQTLGRLAEHLPQMSADPDLVMTRVFDAPPELVFKAWTDPKHLKQWWGPRGFTNPVCEVDLRPGGAIRIHMRAPDGTVYPMTGVFNEIVAPERLVFTSAALDNDGNPMFEVLTVVTFEKQGDKTKLTMQASVTKKTAQAAQHIAGMQQGWTQSLERLADFLQAPRAE
jgi:uncharacterized protein YndB with AHSA1/START domain